MTGPSSSLSLLDERFAVVRLDPEAELPAWAVGGALSSVTRTASELSIVCEEGRVPPGSRVESGWRCLAVSGPLDFAAIGILAALTAELAAAGVSVFVISTYDTDYLLVREATLETAIGALQTGGHTVSVQGSTRVI